jgi:hypothetical protein
MPAMRSSVAKRITLVLVAGLAAAFALWRGAAPPDISHSATPAGAGRGATAGPAERRGGPAAADAGHIAAPAALADAADVGQRRIDALEARLAEEAAQRGALQRRIDELAAELAALRDGAAAAGSSDPVAAAPPPLERQTVDYAKSPMQRALEAAGLDEATAESIKLRGDQLAMSEMYLRDQATREGWLDTPRFREEMEAIEAQRPSIRDDIGDDAYDRYLFALGHTNRVIVNDVMFDSVAEDVGLREGDLIVRYGDERIFAPDDLVASTHQGSSGEPVRLEVVRNGQRLDIEVPRGPLGLRIGPAQDDPDAS